jgi:hypothetical protein
VVAYDRIDDINDAEKVVYVDMSGNIRVRKAVYSRFEKRLVYSCWVGITHWNKLGLGIELPGPPPVLFSAPDEIHKRMQRWGDEQFLRRLGAALQIILQRLQPHISLQRITGSERITEAYQHIMLGRTEPQTGFVLEF